MMRKARKFLLLAAIIALVTFGTSLFTALADSSSINFEAPTYSVGSIHLQDGWSSAGSAGSGCALYDHAVVANGQFAAASFGAQSFRISNAVTSGCFGDQTFSNSLTNEAGETSAVSGGFSGGIRQKTYQVQFNIASTVPAAHQPGLFMSTSADRGDGARMSWVGFEDMPDGIHVGFNDYQDLAPFGGSVNDPNGCDGDDNFFYSDVATLDRSVPHTIKLVIQFVDGPRNDIAKLYVDGVLVKTGTSWEDYFRYCEGNPTRPVDSYLFRTGGPAAPGTSGQGFLVDNMNAVSSTQPADSNACKKGGWQTFTRPDGSPFRNQGDCVSYVQNGR